jgi:hypothetical protein
MDMTFFLMKVRGMNVDENVYDISHLEGQGINCGRKRIYLSLQIEPVSTKRQRDGPSACTDGVQ